MKGVIKLEHFFNIYKSLTIISTEFLEKAELTYANVLYLKQANYKITDLVHYVLRWSFWIERLKVINVMNLQRLLPVFLLTSWIL